MDHIPRTTAITSAELRDLWFQQSSAAGWTFVSDWHDPAVDALCEACLRGENVWATAERLGSVRARSGASLGETLADIDGLVLVAPDVAAEVLYRATSLGWAERMMAPRHAVFDPLTGLVSMDYLRTRLGEVYRASEVAGSHVPTSHALVVVRLELGGRTGWDRITPLILSGDAMRTVFDGGQTLARLADHMAVALTERELMLARRTQLLTAMVEERLGRDRVPAPANSRVWIESLPESSPAAVDLITELAR